CSLIAASVSALWCWKWGVHAAEQVAFFMALALPIGAVIAAALRGPKLVGVVYGLTLAGVVGTIALLPGDGDYVRAIGFTAMVCTLVGGVSRAVASLRGGGYWTAVAGAVNGAVATLLPGSALAFVVTGQPALRTPGGTVFLLATVIFGTAIGALAAAGR